MTISERDCARCTKRRSSLFTILFLLSASLGNAATWTKMTNLMPGGNTVQLMVQLTDGSILVQSYNGFTWMKLTPDATGSYINGTWSTLAQGPTPRLYFASQLLQDGRFWLVGGEYTGPGLLANWANTGEIYDTVADSWSPISPLPHSDKLSVNRVRFRELDERHQPDYIDLPLHHPPGGGMDGKWYRHTGRDNHREHRFADADHHVGKCHLDSHSYSSEL